MHIFLHEKQSLSSNSSSSSSSKFRIELRR